jgi:FeS assembly SUF system protein
MFDILKNRFVSPKPETPPEQLQEQVIEAIREVYDPEISVNLYDLGLIYDIQFDLQNNVSIQMTLTAPACPVAGILPKQVEAAVKGVKEVNKVSVELVWDPPWSRDSISDAGKLSLGIL